MAQREAISSQHIAAASMKDGAAMKALALLTTVFLPGTYLAVSETHTIDGHFMLTVLDTLLYARHGRCSGRQTTRRLICSVLVYHSALNSNCDGTVDPVDVERSPTQKQQTRLVRQLVTVIHVELPGSEEAAQVVLRCMDMANVI